MYIFNIIYIVTVSPTRHKTIKYYNIIIILLLTLSQFNKMCHLFLFYFQDVIQNSVCKQKTDCPVTACATGNEMHCLDGQCKCLRSAGILT